MALTVYRSTDAGAPTLTYAAGSLISVLDACLRTGYGSKAGAGWTKPYTGTNIAVFKQGAGGNNRFLRVWNARTGDDPNTYCMSANARGYENMTAVSTGTNPFPTTAQSGSNGLMIRVAASGPNYTPSWIVRATSSWFSIDINTGRYERVPGVAQYDDTFSFGSFPSLKSGDTYNDFIYGGPNTEYSRGMYADHTTTMGYLSRSDLGTVGARPMSITPCFPGYEPTMGSGSTHSMAYPNRADSSAFLSQYVIVDSGQVRGTLPGVWTSPHGLAPIGWGNTFGGAGSLAGRSFEILAVGTSSDGFIIETSDTFTSAF